MAKQIKKIKINTQELRLLICESIFQTKIYCNEANWECIKSSMFALDNSEAIPQIGEIISNNTLIILMNSSKKIIDVWKGQNIGILHPYIHSEFSFEIHIEILSPTNFYLLVNSKDAKEFLGFFIHSLIWEMLQCFDNCEKPTQKGKVIENLIDQILNHDLFA